MASPPSSQWQRIQTLFDRIADLAEPERSAVLDRECGDDAELRRELAELIASDDGGQAARHAIAAGIASLTSAGYVGQRVGAYRLIEVIGEGGMGVVYLGERADAQYRGRVAIKILRSGFATTHVRARFRDERQILAALDHPGIVRLLDGGTTDDGLPYLVMEHIPGAPLAVHARTLSIRGRIELIVRIARAVQYAHQKLIVHRDLKPSNVLVMRDGMPKLLDFGIAKLLEPSAELPREAQTRTGVALLTVDYASPEQIRGERVAVATDVYSLGAVLYDVLTGQPPQRATGDALETLRIICEVDPPRVSTIAPDAARRELVGDLDNIVARALQKRAVDRYATVGDLADDLERYLTGRPVAAREATVGYRARKLVGRHRGGFAIATLVAAALATATVLSLGQARRADSEARRAERQNRVLLVEQGSQALERGDYLRALPYLVEAIRRGDDSAATRFLIARAVRPIARRRVSFDYSDGLNKFASSLDGSLIATSGSHGVRVFDDAGRPTGFAIPAPTADIAFAGDNKLLVAVPGHLELHDLATGAIERVAAPPETIHQLEVAPDGHRLLVSFDPKGDWVICELAADRCRRLSDGSTTFSFAPQAAQFATGEADGSIHIRTLSGEVIKTLRVRTGSVTAVRYVAADRLFAATSDGAVVLFDLAANEQLAVTTEHHGAAYGLVLSPDGNQILTWAVDGSVRIWDVHTGAAVVSLVGHNRALRNLRWSPDGTRVVSTGVDNTYRVWNARSGNVEFVLETVAASGRQSGAMAGALAAALSRDGRHLITASATELAWWDAGRDELIDDVHTSSLLYSASYSPDERMVALGGNPGYVGLYDLARHAQLFEQTIPGGHVYDAEWRPDGKRFVVAGEPMILRIYRTDGTVDRELVGHTGSVNRALFSPDGTRIATASGDRTVRSWDASTGQQVARLDMPDRASAVSWSRDGHQLVTAAWNGELRLWDAGLQTAAATIQTHRQLLDASLSPDGTRIASAGHGGEIELWDVATAARLSSCEGHTGPATIVAWSPDGQLLASSADDQTARIWDAATCKQLATFLHDGGTMQVMWSRDGRRLLATDNARRFAIWDVDRDHHTLAELDDILAREVPWRLVDGRLELR